MPTLTASKILSRVNKGIQNAKGKIGGDSGLYEIIERSAEQLRESVSFVGAKRKSPSFLIYEDVYEYPTVADDDLDYAKVIKVWDMRDQLMPFTQVKPKHFFELLNMTGAEYTPPYSRTSYRNITATKDENVISVQHEDGETFLMIRTRDSLGKTVLHEMDSYDGNGTWAVGDDAINIATDTQRYLSGGGSVMFDSAGAVADVSISISDMTAVDLTNHLNKSKIFMKLYIPSSTVPDSVTFDWGDDDNNKWSRSVTTQQNGLPFKQGWNLLGFEWLGATKTGSPTVASVNHLKVKLTNASATAQTGYRVDQIRSHLGKEIYLQYYSYFWMKDSSDNSRKAELSPETPNDTSVLLDAENEIWIEHSIMMAHEHLRQTKEAEQKFVHLFGGEGEEARGGLIGKYKRNHPEETEVQMMRTRNFI